MFYEIIKFHNLINVIFKLHNIMNDLKIKFSIFNIVVILTTFTLCTYTFIYNMYVHVRVYMCRK